MSNILRAKFWKIFSRFLILGISFIILLAGVTQSNTGSGFVLADDCEQQGGCPPPQVIPPAPAPPAQPTTPTCTPSDQTGTVQDCGDGSNGSNSSQWCTYNLWLGSTCNTGRGGAYGCQTVPGKCGVPSTPVCEKKDVIGTVEDCVGDEVCTFNIWQGPKGDGSCQTGRGGAFGCEKVVGRCGVSAPVAAAAQTGTCFVCDNTDFADGQGRWRPAGGCSAGMPVCQANNSSTFGGCTGATEGAICATVQQPPVTCPAGTTLINGQCQPNIACPTGTTLINNVCQPNITCPAGTTLVNGSCQASVVVPPQAPINITNNPTNTNTNTNTITNNVTWEVVREVVRGGNVGVGTSVVAVAGTTTTALPKTGLPALAWAAAAFLPLGFRMKKFSKGIASDDDNPNYLWEDRKFKRS